MHQEKHLHKKSYTLDRRAAGHGAFQLDEPDDRLLPEIWGPDIHHQAIGKSTR